MYQKVGKILLPLDSFYAAFKGVVLVADRETGRFLRIDYRSSQLRDTYLISSECCFCRKQLIVWANACNTVTCLGCEDTLRDSLTLAGSSAPYIVGQDALSTPVLEDTSVLRNDHPQWSRVNSINYQFRHSSVRTLTGRHNGQPALGIGSQTPLKLERIAYDWDTATEIAMGLKRALDVST